jgi:hypothetical protein
MQEDRKDSGNLPFAPLYKCAKARLDTFAGFSSRLF